MARIRTIKPDFWRDELLSGVSAEAALLAIGLLNHCDDEGFFNANPKLVESDVFPLRNLSKKTTELLRELYEIGYINAFSGSDGKTYAKVSNFEKHQVINKKTPSKIKELCVEKEDYCSTTVVLPTGKERNGSGKGNIKKEPLALVPDWLSLETWNAFVEMRKKIKKPMTEYAMKLLLGKLTKMKEAGVDVDLALQNSILHGWQDVYEPKKVEHPVAGKQLINGRDPTLIQLEQDFKKATPMPSNIREMMKGVVKTI